MVRQARQREHPGERIIDSYDGYSSGAQAAATALLVWAVFAGLLLLVTAVGYLVTAVPLAALFAKTGVERWKAWVPVLNTYTWLRLGGQNGNWAWAALVPYGALATNVFLYIGMHRTGRAFGKGAGFLVLGVLLPWLWLAVLGFGRCEYRPETLGAHGWPPPLVGRGAALPRSAADYEAVPYPAPPVEP